MTRTLLRAQVRARGRFNQMVSDALIDGYLNEAAVRFSADTKMLTKTISFTIQEKFSLTTSEAFKLTIATAGESYLVNGDILLATAQTDVSGAVLASAIQAIIQSSAVGASNTTFTYATATRMFTINASAESSVISIAVATPATPVTYHECIYKLFGALVSDSASGTSYTGGAAPFCQSESKLPSDFLEVDELIYGDDYDIPLQPEIYRGRSYAGGTPSFFSISRQASGDYLRVTPHPATKETRMELTYNYKAAEIATGTAGDSSSYPFNTMYDDALIYYAIYLAKLGCGPDEVQGAFTAKAQYREIVDDAINDKWVQHGGGFDMSQRGRSGL